MRRILRHKLPCAALVCAFLLGLAVEPAFADTGGARYVPPPPPAKRGRIVNGEAIAPRGAPRRVKQIIAAANRIIDKPYVYGGGHHPYDARSARIASLDRGYDCSGSVSFALFGGRFLRSPLDSSGFMRWGHRGRGRWITVYTNPGHAYLVVAGLRFDTSRGDRVGPEEQSSGTGPRWRKYNRSPRGFRARHPRRY